MGKRSEAPLSGSEAGKGRDATRAAAAPSPSSERLGGTAPAAPELTGGLTRAVLPCEIRVVDEARREIELCATSEAVDSYGTIFGYEASRDAFARWVGNVREMHDRKAVGSKVAVRFDDAARKTYVRVRISKGAQDTWEKVLDGTLKGASIGASNVRWEQRRVAGAGAGAGAGNVNGGGGDAVPYATYYDLAELSLVDNPSNPDALVHDQLALSRTGSGSER